MRREGEEASKECVVTLVTAVETSTALGTGAEKSPVRGVQPRGVSTRFRGPSGGLCVSAFWSLFIVIL